jgi:glutathione peroxidase-family protein
MTDTQLSDIALTTLDGRPTTLAELADGAALVVNVASKCGLTPQYSALEQLAKDYGGRGLTVIGVPCNQFMGQEPGTAEEIQTFCSTTYGVTFPLLAKTDVNGADRRCTPSSPMCRTAAVRRATCNGTSRSSCSRRTDRWSRGSVRAPLRTRRK